MTAALTRREWQVAQLTGEGLANKEIANELGIAERTVKNHLHRIFQKLGVEHRRALMLYLLRPPDGEQVAIARAA